MSFSENDSKLKKYSNSTLSSYCEYIEQDIPESLKATYKRIIGTDIKAVINDIVNEYLMDKSDLVLQGYEFIKSVSSSDVDKIQKKQKYHCTALLTKLEEDYNTALSGKIITDSASCLNEAIVSTLVSVSKGNRKDVIESIYSGATEWLKKLMTFKAPDRDEWIEENVGFCNYPYFYLIESSDINKAKKLINIDLIATVFRLSKDLKFKDFNIYSPKSILGEGFVDESGNRTSKFRENYDLALLSKTKLKETFFEEEKEASEVNIMAKRTWDYSDMMIFNYLCTKCIRNLSDISGGLVVSGSLTEICAIVYPNIKNRRFNASHYETAKERLENVFNTRVTAHINGKTASKSIFDYSVIDDPKEHIQYDDNDGSELSKLRKSRKDSSVVLFQATFGRRISGDILNSRLETIVRPQIESINTEIAKMLFMSLKNDRIMDLYFHNQQTRIFSHDSFMIIIRLSDKKAKRLQKYSDALKELKDKHLLIDDFKVIGEMFEVKWIPLSEQERDDIRIIPPEMQLTDSEL